MDTQKKVLIGLGSFVALRLLWTRGEPLSGSLALDLGFVALFLLRGVMNIRAGRRATSDSR